MAKLTSLKQDYKEWSEPVGVDKDEYYPSIYFDENTLDQLGLNNPRVGTEMTMVSTVRISSTSESSNGQRSMSIEILEAALSPKEEEKDAASILFPNG
jgi:hypothetical protein